MNLNKEVSNYVAAAKTEQKSILNELRKVTHSSVNNVNEQTKWGFPVFNNGMDFTYLSFAKKSHH